MAKEKIPYGEVLHPKQKKFLQEYTKDYNAKAAGKRAGYSDASSSAHQLLKTNKAQAYLKELQEEMQERTNITKDRILKKLIDMVDDEETSKTHQLKAIEIINKMLGFNEPDKHDITHKGISINYIQPLPPSDKGSSDNLLEDSDKNLLE